MQTDEMILAEELCSYYKIEYSFLDELQQYGLLTVTRAETRNYVPHDQLRKLEQLIRLRYELNINLEGLDVVSNLLDTINRLQDEMTSLRNRLKLYEEIV